MGSIHFEDPPSSGTIPTQEDGDFIEGYYWYIKLRCWFIAENVSMGEKVYMYWWDWESIITIECNQDGTPKRNQDGSLKIVAPDPSKNVSIQSGTPPNSPQYPVEKGSPPTKDKVTRVKVPKK